MSLTKRIVVTGPESSGKTTLCKQLAIHYNTQYISEYARTYLEKLERPYQQKDLLAIAQGQVALENAKKHHNKPYLFFDTGIEVIKLWSLIKYQSVDQRIENLLQTRSYDLYLLCQPDLAWESDPLREASDQKERWEIYDWYVNELNQHNIPWFTISGEGEKRIMAALRLIDHHFGHNTLLKSFE